MPIFLISKVQTKCQNNLNAKISGWRIKGLALIYSAFTGKFDIIGFKNYLIIRNDVSYDRGIKEIRS